ncbi:hypothetical protein [Acetobacter syzygii]|uniref:Uncharacterized protein n=1 Tax=Acetobacter syzygii TaxID=146476 RepID=A0A270B9R4_9PROT|nr:hypothetical protein [Acetobacter syzygii]PAL20926.1 hypothetical protein B9K05_12045 [Acetobacter syzygii]PAL22981.1 hypothetical protein B9K04_12010 [Acetobacter syzygii]
MSIHCAWCERDIHDRTHIPYCCARCEKKATKALAAINAPQSALQRETRLIRGCLVTLVAVIAVTFSLRILAGSPPPPDDIVITPSAPSSVAIQNSEPYKAGQIARRHWNLWLGGQHGERRKGAIYWLNAVTGQHAKHCDGTAEFALGCFDAHRHISRSESLLATDPEFIAGWNTP